MIYTQTICATTWAENIRLNAKLYIDVIYNKQALVQHIVDDAANLNAAQYLSH